MDPLHLLTEDHEKVKKLLEELDSTTADASDRRRQLFSQIRREMEIHETIEEEILYPALKSHAEAKEVVLEGYEEHHVVDTIMAELDDLSFEDETWGAKLSVMKENIEHHIEEEEEEMFVKARELLEEAELEGLGDRMAARKKELQGS
ncbi:MAG: hemerythrin domain-containing protein [Actinomycetota bacterium]|nr:hemerythrin domain-containing protein [Actinomycetota bacterium]